MSCSHPLEFWCSSSGAVHYGAHTEPFYVGKEYFNKKIEVPCGHCVACKIKYSYDWTARLLCELDVSSSAYFITLTYDDEHLPFNKNGAATLCKSDVQNFIKRCRNVNIEKLRYFFVGEYGSKSSRPHYHGIIFNLQLDDLVPSGYKMFTSLSLQNLWQRGIISVQDVNSTTCRYVTGYLLKDMRSRKDFLDLDLVPPFTLVSRRPGLGRSYYDKNKNLLANGSKLYLSDGSSRSSLRIFDRWIQKDFGDDKLIALKLLRRDKSDLFSSDVSVFDRYEELNYKNAVDFRQQKKGVF